MHVDGDKSSPVLQLKLILMTINSFIRMDLSELPLNEEDAENMELLDLVKFPFMSGEYESEEDTIRDQANGMLVDPNSSGYPQEPPLSGFERSGPNDGTSAKDFWNSDIAAMTARSSDSSSLLALGGSEKGKIGKFCPPPPFNSHVPLREKYERWLQWKIAFDVALAVVDGCPSELQKTGLLHTHAGDEVRMIIATMSLPPLHGGRTCPGGEYAILSEGLNKYFRSLVSGKSDYVIFKDRKQKKDEDIHQYTLNLRALAMHAGIGFESNPFRVTFLEGLKDRSLAEKADDEDLPIADVVLIGGRRELRMEELKDKPGHEMLPRPVEVMSIDKKKQPWKGPRSAGGKRSFSGAGQNLLSKARRCGRCGGRAHEGRICPAIGKSCNICKKMDHYAVCCRQTRKQTNRVETVTQPKYEAVEENFQVLT